ncbi:MAG: diguanylate cyclase domain-containing protein, partial [Spirochaetota bacterium]
MNDRSLYNTLDERLDRIVDAVDRVQEHFKSFRAVIFAWCPDSGPAMPTETNLPQRVVSFDRVLARNVSEAVILLDDELEILYANLSAARLVGTSENLLIGRSIDSFLLGPPGNTSRAVVSEAYQTLAPGGSLPLHGFSARTRIGEAQPVNVVLARPEPSEDPSALILAQRTEEHESASHTQSVEYLVYHDQLTSLGNRELLTHSIDQLLAEVTRSPDRTAALLYLDLDGFKKVNDSLGHGSGDVSILDSSRRIGATLRGYDRV